ncbi:MAG: hypothetical protein GQ544_09465, partial [Candidatus Aminicenantes bacterium]|nr:hypothetical protein [Candidatus Aminicenantes bacterium]
EEFDLLVGVTADAVEKKCAKCGSSKLKKTIGSFSVRMGSSSSPSNCSSGSCCPTC